MGSRDVSVYTREDGVWYPPAPEPSSLRWMGGPLARYSNSSRPLNPFCRSKLPVNQVSAASLSYTERGDYTSFMHLPSGPCDSRLGGGYPDVQDCTDEEEKKRGNQALARLNEKPEHMSEQQYLAFCAVREFPCLQIRKLSSGLEQETLMMDRPEVPLELLTACVH